ncbi:MAG: hypothetical protein SF028_09315 [Candidatus Sumerlaeia bacterium]|nr:hypothetical protein [Candidatus Sumerlaeia bacterium]
MTKDTIRRTLTPLALGFAGGLLALAFAPALRPAPAVAQNASAEAVPTVEYSMRVYPAGADRVLARGSSFEQVLAFKDSPVFLTKNGTRLTVVVPTDRGLKILREITLTDKFKEIVLLGDSASFAIRASNEVVVYTVDAKYEVVTQE